jgi:hypothetical protein
MKENMRQQVFQGIELHGDSVEGKNGKRKREFTEHGCIALNAKARSRSIH